MSEGQLTVIRHQPEAQERAVALLEEALEAARAGRVHGIAIAFTGRDTDSTPIFADAFAVSDFGDAMIVSGMCLALANKLYAWQKDDG